MSKPLKPGDAGYEAAIRKCWETLAPLALKAKQYLAIEPVVRRLEDLRTQDIALSAEAQSIVNRLDELKPVACTPEEAESVSKRLRQIMALTPEEIDDSSYPQLEAEIVSMGQRLEEIKDCDAELDALEHALNNIEATRTAIEKEAEPLVKQLDRFLKKE